MRIAVVADTHDRLPPTLLPSLAGADEVWHLGDVTHSGVLEEFRALICPLRVVRGNCDADSDWPLQLDFSVEGHAIRLIHIPPRLPDPLAQLLLHGHTHVPRDEQIGPTRFLNPGCITRPNRGAPASYAWLTLRKGATPEWELRLLK